MCSGPAGDGQGPGIKGQEAADDLTIYSALNLEYRRQVGTSGGNYKWWSGDLWWSVQSCVIEDL